MEPLERILRQNPWWEGKEIEAISGLKERPLLEEILKYRDDRQIIAVIGLRRVGKTVLVLQFINRLLREVDSRRVLYFSFDEIAGKRPEIIEEVLKVYEEEVLREELKNVYIFFDEINHIENWQVILKRYYDLNKRIKFVVSGSSSIYLRRTRESLAGRIYEFELEPLSFGEFLYLRGIEVKDLTIQSPTLRRELNNYFVRGGFPEIMDERDFEKARKYVSSVMEKIVFYDIPKVYDVAEPELLREILGLIARRPGSLVEYRKIASALNLSYQTVSKYVGYLERAFLVRMIYNYRGSPIARARKLKKAYLGTPSLALAFMGSEGEVYSIIPELAENLVATHLGAKFFWRKYYEVDFLHDNVPVEVKYRESPEDIDGALEAAKKLNSNRLVVVTKDLEKKERRGQINVSFTPLWKFLLTKVAGKS
jgi:hypothetical protein